MVDTNEYKTFGRHRYVLDKWVLTHNEAKKRAAELRNQPKKPGRHIYVRTEMVRYSGQSIYLIWVRGA